VTFAYKIELDAVPGMMIAQSPEDLQTISDDDCAGVIWHREPLDTFQEWIDTLDTEQLPAARLILRPEDVRDAVAKVCGSVNMPEGIECTRLIDDITALSTVFADVMKAPFVRLRLARVTSNACRKFHVDALTARLICTYRGTGTQYGTSKDGADPENIFTAPTGAPIVLRGTKWAEQPKSGLVHRSPPIEGSGETRFVVVIDPVFDPEDEFL